MKPTSLCALHPLLLCGLTLCRTYFATSFFMQTLPRYEETLPYFRPWFPVLLLYLLISTSAPLFVSKSIFRLPAKYRLRGSLLALLLSFGVTSSSSSCIGGHWHARSQQASGCFSRLRCPDLRPGLWGHFFFFAQGDPLCEQ